MMPEDDEGVLSRSNTQRIPVSLIKHLQKLPALHATRNAEIVENQTITNKPPPIDLSVISLK